MIAEREPVAAISVTQKLGRLGQPVEEDRWAHLRRFARLTALKSSREGSFHFGHWWRGPLLYGLVQQGKPGNILEFGTGRGYGALCMSQAAEDAGLDCTIWTIDRIPPTTPQPWALDEGHGPGVQRLALADVWAKHVPPKLTRRIRCLTGDSWSVMSAWERHGSPRVDFCFIDGGHDYWTVKHDFIAALSVANARCGMLFDDYTQRNGYGVKRLVDQDVMPHVPREAVDIVHTLSRDHTAYGEDVEHQMAFVRGEYLGTEPREQFYSSDAVHAFERRHQIQRLATGLKTWLRGSGKTGKVLAQVP